MVKIGTNNLGILRNIAVLLIFGFFLFGFFLLCVLERGTLAIHKLGSIREIDISKTYMDFIKKHQEKGKVISMEEFWSRYNSAKEYLGSWPSGKTTKDLRQTIIKTLNIEFLLNGLNRRELTVITVAIHKELEYAEHNLLFVDPEVGLFSVLLLVPDREERSYPAIIGLHGHGDANNTFRDLYYGKELAQAGFIVIMPSFRAMNLDEEEVAVSQELYLNGFTLMGLRVYETHLLIKYLKQKGLIGRNKIGIVGHSGGSVVANLVSRISRDVKAIGIDLDLDMLELFEDEFIHCTSIPELSYYDTQLNDFSNLKIPSYKFTYAYTDKDVLNRIISFFKNALSEKHRSTL